MYGSQMRSHSYEITRYDLVIRDDIVSRNYEIVKTYYVAHTGFRNDEWFGGPVNLTSLLTAATPNNRPQPAAIGVYSDFWVAFCVVALLCMLIKGLLS